MPQPQQNITISAPAFQGVNTEDSPIAQDATFAQRANNAVIDDLGRIAARKGFSDYLLTYDLADITPPVGQTSYVVKTHSMAHSSGLAPFVGCEVEWFDAGSVSLGVEYYFAVINLTTRTLRFLPYPPATTLNLNHVKGAITPMETRLLGGTYFIFSDGNEALYQDSANSLALLSSYSDVSNNYIGPQDDSTNLAPNGLNGDVACAAYGRMWVTGVEDNYQRIHYSNLEDPTQWYDGKAVPTNSLNTGGIIDVSQYWPSGRDVIQNIVAHNNMLVVFGRNSILLYGNPQGDPAAIGGIFLQDTIDGLGLVGRDAVQVTGTDLLYVDDTGVRSLGRSIQEQSAAIGDLTKNVRTEIQTAIRTTQDKSTISLAYWPQEGFAVCNLPDAEKAYVIDSRAPASNGGARVTTWSEVTFDRSIHIEDGNDTLVLLGATDTGAVKQYENFVDGSNSPYTFSYESNPLTFGDSVRQKFPKRYDLTIVSRDSTTAAEARWGMNGTLEYSKSLSVDASEPAFWGEALFGEALFGNGDVTLKRYRINTKGSGSTVKLGLDATIQGGLFSLQELNIQTLLGRIY